MDLKKQKKKETDTRKPMTRTMEAYCTYYRNYSEWLENKLKNNGVLADGVGQSKQCIHDWGKVCVSPFRVMSFGSKSCKKCGERKW